MFETKCGIVTVSVLMAVHNRRSTTEECLSRLLHQSGINDHFRLSIFIVDDGSTDGTGAMLNNMAQDHPLQVIEGDGGLFWARAMAKAHEHAVSADPDFLLWLNDDLQLSDTAVLDALAAARQSPASIIVGATLSSSGDQVTYTGSRLSSSRPTSLRPVLPSGTPEQVDAFNGNFVLVPRAAYRCLGSIDTAFEHGYGDIDYGLRAKKAGIPTLLLSGPVGTCDANSHAGTWRDQRMSRRDRLRLLFGRKGVPARSHWRFNLRHGGARGPMYFFSTYLRAGALILLGRPT
ncbi:GT2 family glycosyltransferase [Microbacterium marinum]|uniref:GT2 family glycosyltransferase n=1 Tax=Microbacterium marinum TaxID=421115 RepID=A0A7W7BR23_9MICO|nr:glycosyltransferase family 2 protein [Microbacterium marinum]MBB4666139.1 GT2 family glycosyltransferase [Microbacterium marinum]